MMWHEHEAKARFGAFLEASLREGPQVVTRRGVETAVLVPIEQWRRMRPRSRLKELLGGFLAADEMLAPAGFAEGGVNQFGPGVGFA